MTCHLSADTRNLIWLLFPCASDACQNIAECWHVVALNWRKISARIERLEIGSKEDRHGPTTGPCHCHGGLHVNGIDIRALFAVDFDVDKVLVHESGDSFVFKRFMCHDMAPVTGGISDAEKDGFVFCAGFG